jgi:hypothetical protein
MGAATGFARRVIGSTIKNNPIRTLCIKAVAHAVIMRRRGGEERLRKVYLNGAFAYRSARVSREL